MWGHRWIVLRALFILLVASASARAQRPGMMGAGMMGTRHDSATMAQMAVIHELILNHDRITRTVTNLPDGIRTVTESNDPLLARRIKEHVVTMNQRVAAADDPGLPIESAALRAIYRNGDKIRTVVDTTRTGIIVVQTSRDSVTVAALQQHASEVSDLVRGGMTAMHQAMMKNGGGMMQRPDSTFAAMQMRGEKAMGVDQHTSTHTFDALSDGGRIELQRDVDDSAGVAPIRAHLQEIAKAFKSGDFSTPGFVHIRTVPGTEVMAAKRDVISYTYRELPRGGEVRIVSNDPAALKAIYEFLEFQRQEHHAGGMDHRRMPR